MVNQKAFKVTLTEELFEKYFDVNFTCAEYIAAAQLDNYEYLTMREAVETNLFGLTDAQYDEVLDSQVTI